MQWLSGIMLDFGLKGREFKTHLEHCVVFLSKILHPLLSTDSSQEDGNSSRHDCKLFDVKNQTNIHLSFQDFFFAILAIFGKEPCCLSDWEN